MTTITVTLDEIKIYDLSVLSPQQRQQFEQYCIDKSTSRYHPIRQFERTGRIPIAYCWMRVHIRKWKQTNIAMHGILRFAGMIPQERNDWQNLSNAEKFAFLMEDFRYNCL